MKEIREKNKSNVIINITFILEILFDTQQI